MTWKPLHYPTQRGVAARDLATGEAITVDLPAVHGFECDLVAAAPAPSNIRRASAVLCPRYHETLLRLLARAVKGTT